jgi:hypothetical protein
MLACSLARCGVVSPLSVFGSFSILALCTCGRGFFVRFVTKKQTKKERDSRVRGGLDAIEARHDGRFEGSYLLLEVGVARTTAQAIAEPVVAGQQLVHFALLRAHQRIQLFERRFGGAASRQSSGLKNEWKWVVVSIWVISLTAGGAVF